MPPKMRQMLRDLREIKQGLLHDDRKADHQLSSTGDPFECKKLELTQLLDSIRQNVGRVVQLRANSTDGRDLASIRLASDNGKDIKTAIELWKAAKQLVLIAQANKAWDAKTVDDRKHALGLLHQEIRDVSDKNAGKAAAPTKPRRKKGRRHRGSDGGADEKHAVEIEVVDMGPARQPSIEEQEFVQAVCANKQQEDAMLDELVSSVGELNELAKTMQNEIAVGSAIASELDTKIGKLNSSFKAGNDHLAAVIHENGGASRWCPMIVCTVILLALLAYIYQTVS